MLLGVIQLLCSQRRGGDSGAEGWGSHQCKPNYLVPIKYPVHKLLGIVTRYLVCFIKGPVLLKITVPEKLFSVCVWNCKSIKFAKNNHLIITFHMENCLYVEVSSMIEHLQLFINFLIDISHRCEKTAHVSNFLIF